MKDESIDAFSSSFILHPSSFLMTYQVIARKWRPQTFDEVTGQEPITRTLRNAIEHQRLHHAYLFSGARGVAIDYPVRGGAALLFAAILGETLSNSVAGVRARCGIFSRSA